MPRITVHRSFIAVLIAALLALPALAEAKPHPSSSDAAHGNAPETPPGQAGRPGAQPPAASPDDETVSGQASDDTDTDTDDDPGAPTTADFGVLCQGQS